MAFPAATVTPPALSIWQASVGGLKLGLTTPYTIKAITGLGLDQVRSGDSARARDQGQLVGLDLLAGRTLTLTLSVDTPTTGIELALKALALALPPGTETEIPFWIKLPHLPLLASMVRVRKRHFPVNIAFAAGLGNVSALLHSTDPRLYGPTEVTTAGLPTPAGGLTFPVTFPATFGGGSSGDSVIITNTGNVEMRRVLVITGPCTNPKVVNSTTGWSLTFSNPFQSGYTLTTGTVLTVTLDLRTVTLTRTGTSVGSSRESWVVAGSVWPNVVSGIYGLAVGSNTIAFSSSDAAAVAGSLAVQWASAYLL
jgi:hypothetical protein